MLSNHSAFIETRTTFSPKAREGEHDPQTDYHSGSAFFCFVLSYTLFGAVESKPRAVCPLGFFGSFEEWRMLQSNPICVKQQLRSQPDTGDFTPLSSESLRGEILRWEPNQRKMQSLTKKKNHNKVFSKLLPVH